MSNRLIDEFKVCAKKANADDIEIKQIAEAIDDIHRALGYKAGVITVNDTNFSGRIKELINQEENEYGNKD